MDYSDKTISITAKCLALYFVLMPLDSIRVLGMGSLLKVVALLPIASILIVKRKSRLKLSKMVIWSLIYLLSVMISCVYSINLDNSLQGTKRLLLNMVLVLCVGGIYDDYTRAEYDYLMKALVWGGIANIVLTFLNPDTTNRYGRLTLSIAGSTQDMNYINGYMLFALAFFLKKLIKDKALLALFPIVGIFVFTMMTGSRGSLLALVAIVISSFLYVFFVEKKGRLVTILIVVTSIVLICIFYQRILGLISPAVAQRYTIEYIWNYSGTNRPQLWLHLLAIYRQSSLFRQIFGYGAETVYIVNTLTNQVAHNLWLDHLIGTGLVGLVIFSGMQICYLKEALKSKDVVLISSYIGFLTMCFTLSLVSYKPIWNCMMMIMIASRIRVKEETVSDNM